MSTRWADRLGLLVVAGGAGLTVFRVGRLAAFAAPAHRLPRVRHEAPASASYAVTAVVPARDEEAHLPGCLEALARCGPELTEIVVVDDGSTDRTADRAGAMPDPRVRVVTSPGPRPGECGKPVACAMGAASATGRWLWFVDADVIVAPDLLRRLLAAADESSADLISAVGRPLRRDGLTGWLLPEVGFAVARRHGPHRVADPSDPAVFASGQCLLVRRDVYRAVGGHQAVAGSVVEDVDLARAVQDRGGHVVLAAAFDGFTVDMYADANAMWWGLLRNTSAVHGAGWTAAARSVLGAALGVAAPVLAIGPGRRSLRQAAAAATLLTVLVDAGARAVARQPVLPAALAPLADGVLAGHRAHALIRRGRGATVGWRGRQVRPS